MGSCGTDRRNAHKPFARFSVLPPALVVSVQPATDESVAVRNRLHRGEQFNSSLRLDDIASCVQAEHLFYDNREKPLELDLDAVDRNGTYAGASLWHRDCNTPPSQYFSGIQRYFQSGALYPLGCWRLGSVTFGIGIFFHGTTPSK